MNWKILVPLVAVVFTAIAGLTEGNATGRMTGGIEDADANDKPTQNALHFAVVQHNRVSNEMFVSEVARLIKTQKQVVAGMKYIFTVEMGRTSCKKGGAETVCAVHADPLVALPYQCKFEVWSRPWLNDIQLVKHTCLPQGQSFN